MAEIINLEEEKLKSAGVKALMFIERDWGTEMIDTKVSQRTIFDAISYMWTKYPQAARTALLQLQKKDEYNDL